MVEQPDPAPPPPAAAGRTPAEIAAAKALKKKAKARKEWYTFAGRVAAQVVGAAASVGLGLFILQRSQQADSEAPAPPPARLESPRTSAERAVAVLPLSDFSEDARQYFADGMTEALTAQLAQIDGLHVISRTSAMQYKTGRKPIPVVAQELGVDFVVEGSVVRADHRVRVTAQLIDARSDEHVWARSYDGTMQDILDLQARVAAAIATEVKGVLIPASGTAPRPVDPVAYDLYLRGRHAWSLRTPEGFANAIKYFTSATERDPEFALAYAGLADAFSLFPTASLVNRSVDTFARAREAAQKAIALDPNLAEAHTSLAAVYFFGERDFDAAAKEFERALELNAHYPTAHQWYAIALSENGRHADARRHADEAVMEDPLNGVMHQALGLVHYYARDFGAAIAAQRRALELNPQLPLARVVLAKALLMAGRPQETLDVLRQSPQPDAPDGRLMTAIAHARTGNRPAAEAIIRGLESRTPPLADLLVQWHAATGDHDAAFNLMQASRRSGATVPVVLRVDPLYDNFRADRRFAASR
jgi:TolB-like protein/Tfp pilus assembly protein PilF